MNDCPLPPTSDLPFDRVAVEAWLAGARAVLAAWDTAPLEAHRAIFLASDVPTWVETGAQAVPLAARAAPGNEASRLTALRRTRGGLTGDVLCQEREAAGAPLRLVAQEAGISRSQLQAIETGHRRSTPAMRERIRAAITMLGRDRVPRRCRGCDEPLPLEARETQWYCRPDCAPAVMTKREQRRARERLWRSRNRQREAAA